jgi:imidazole glycerol-phosphate synthase subunit HisF
MLKHRVIPSLLLLNDGLVKTTRFKNSKYVGDPINAVRIFNEKEVDELILLDIGASKNKREPNYELIEQIAGECFMPLAYGGGVCSADQAQQLFSLGVEKICVQTSAIKDLSVVKQIAERFGSQSVMVSVDIKKNWLGKYNLYSAAKGAILGQCWIDFMLQAIAAGAGEVVLNAVDRDGMMDGMDLKLIQEASTLVTVPLIAVGGVGCLDDIRAAVAAGASAVAAGAFFVFHGPHRAVLITYPQYEELEFLFDD